MSQVYIIALCGPPKCGKTQIANALKAIFPEIEQRSLRLPGATQARAQVGELAKSRRAWSIITLDDVITTDTLEALKTANHDDVARVYCVRVVGDSEDGDAIMGCARGMDIRDARIEQFDFVVDTRCAVGKSRDAHLERLAQSIGAIFDFKTVIKNMRRVSESDDPEPGPVFFLPVTELAGLTRSSLTHVRYIDHWTVLAPTWRQILELRQQTARIGMGGVIAVPGHDVTDEEILTALQEHYGTTGQPPD